MSVTSSGGRPAISAASATAFRTVASLSLTVVTIPPAQPGRNPPAARFRQAMLTLWRNSVEGRHSSVGPRTHVQRTLQPARSRAPLAIRLGRAPPLRGRSRRPAPQILRAGDVPLSLRPHPHGPRAQLCHGRRARPLSARPGLQRAAPHGLGRLRHAGGERRDAHEGASAQMDLRQHRRDAYAAEVDGPVDRLDARVRHLRRRLLRPAAAAVPRLPRGRPGHPQAGARQLGPGRPDGSGQRAGDRRQGLALRRSGRAARPDAMVPAHHRLQRGPAGGTRPSLPAGRRRCA